MPKSVWPSLKETLFSGFIGEGLKVKEFEAALATMIGNPHALSLNSCTSGLHLALRLSGIGYGDEVISTPMTCVATNEPILANGAKIVWADVDPKIGNISPESIKRKITKKTKAVIVVHWGGYPADMLEINTIARNNNIKVIEDAAHALGSEYQGKMIGCHSDFVCFSFQAIKHITTIDGGALFCKRKSDYNRGKLLRWYGINRETNRKNLRCEDDIKEWGYKFHMNDVAATIGIEQFKHLPKIIKQRRHQADYYTRKLKGVKGVTLPEMKADRLSSYWLFTIFVERRAEFMKKMSMANIMVSNVHARNDTHTMFKESKTKLPFMDQFYKKLVCIPVGYWVTRKDQDYIIKTIREGW
jgi:dTDP-4-amino-4,6-dideoxygalactose transaminase